MRAPKHLWSGDWERESAAVSEDLASLKDLPGAAPEPDPRPVDASRPMGAPRPVGVPRPVGAPRPVDPAGTEPNPARRPEPSRATAASRTASWIQLPQIQLPRIRIPPVSSRTLRTIGVALTLLLVLAAGAYGLGALLGSSAPRNTPAATGSPTPMAWLGMEVVTVNPGRVVVETVSSGSQGERSGFEPGDVMIAIDSRGLASTRDISKAIFGMQAGDQVQIEVGRGSTVFVTSATLGAPPAKYP